MAAYVSNARDTAKCYRQHVDLNFHFNNLLDNLPTSPVAFIHAGFNHMKTRRRATPNG